MATVGFQASNLFAVNSNFHEQSSSSIDNETIATILDEVGNNECVTGNLDTTTQYSNEFSYCNAVPDLKGDIGTLLTQFGDVFDSKKVDSVTINFTAGEYATVSVSGHQHAENAHTSALADGYADVSAVIPASAGFGVPTFAGQVAGANASPVSASVTFSCNHVDRVDEGGDHFVGNSITFQCEISVEWIGEPTTPESTGFTTQTKGGNDSNQDYDGYTYTAIRWFDRATS